MISKLFHIYQLYLFQPLILEMRHSLKMEEARAYFGARDRCLERSKSVISFNVFSVFWVGSPDISFIASVNCWKSAFSSSDEDGNCGPRGSLFSKWPRVLYYSFGKNIKLVVLTNSNI